MNSEIFNTAHAILCKYLGRERVDAMVEQGLAVYARLRSKVQTTDEFGMDPVLVSMLRPLFEFLYNDWWRVKCFGVKNIPVKGPAIIVANHSGMLPYDAVMLNMAVYSSHPRHRNVRFLVADFVDNFPIVSQLISRAGGVKASPENAEKLLKNGETICVFPEGISGIGKLYSERYKLQDFGRGGVIKLAQKTGVPIIPCAIIGAEEIHPIVYKFEHLGQKIGLPYFPVTPTFPLLGILGLIPIPSKWKINFGNPIRYKKSKSSVIKLRDDLKAKLQRLVDETR